MNRFTNMLKPEAEARIRTEIGSISGLAIERITAMPPMNMNTMGLLDVRIRLTGWSPSLNILRMVWRTTVSMEDDAITQGERLVERLSDRLEIQRQRLAEGMSLGSASPFWICDDDGRREDTRWGHILVDRALAHMIEDRRAGDFDREVSDVVWDLHQADDDDHDGTEMVLSGESTDDDCKPIGRRSLHGRMLRQDHEIAKGIVFDGKVVYLSARIPETIMTAAEGRTLGELVDVPASIAGRRIISVSAVKKRAEVEIETELARADVLLAAFEGEDA